MSDRDRALYHLHEWWLAGNDETLHHAGAALLKVMEDCGWVQIGTRKMVTVWDDGAVDRCQDVAPVKVYGMTDLGRKVLMDWMRAKWTSGRPGKRVAEMKEAIEP